MKSYVSSLPKWWYVATGFLSICAIVLATILTRPEEARALGDSNTTYTGTTVSFDNFGPCTNDNSGDTPFIVYWKWKDAVTEMDTWSTALSYTKTNGTHTKTIANYTPTNVKLGTVVSVGIWPEGWLPNINYTTCSGDEIGDWQHGATFFVLANYNQGTSAAYHTYPVSVVKTNALWESDEEGNWFITRDCATGFHHDMTEPSGEPSYNYGYPIGTQIGVPCVAN